jgi:hypothetical protein
MIGKAEQAGLLLWDDYMKRVLMLPDPDCKMYDSRSGIARIYVKKVREIPQGSKIHESVFQRIENKENLYAPENIPDVYTVYNDDGPVQG